MTLCICKNFWRELTRGRLCMKVGWTISWADFWPKLIKKKKSQKEKVNWVTPCPVHRFLIPGDVKSPGSVLPSAAHALPSSLWELCLQKLGDRINPASLKLCVVTAMRKVLHTIVVIAGRQIMTLDPWHRAPSNSFWEWHGRLFSKALVSPSLQVLWLYQAHT